MSYCKEEGKDKIIFVTQEDHESPVKDDIISILDDDPEDEAEGLILPSGEINWNCPCLGGMPSGPCGSEFRDAFSCFHYSEADPKGSDCLEKFRDMQVCMSGYPELYPPKEEEDGNEEGDEEATEGDSTTEGITSSEEVAAISKDTSQLGDISSSKEDEIEQKQTVTKNKTEDATS